jgi:segregation and condensation protein B
MESAELKRIIEALLFVTDRPLPIAGIKDTLGEDGKGVDLEEIVKEIEAEYQQRNSPIELRYVAGGWQFNSKKEFSHWVRKLYKEKTTLKLSPSALETLSIIAYKQPITRAEIEEIRGVEVSGVLETILERKLVKIVGRKETLGRPLLYGTTHEFLRHFGLSHLSELPSIDELTPPEKEAEDNSAAEPELPLNGAPSEETETGEALAAAEANEEAGNSSEETPITEETSVAGTEEAGAVPAEESVVETADEPEEPAPSEEAPADQRD